MACLPVAVFLGAACSSNSPSPSTGAGGGGGGGGCTHFDYSNYMAASTQYTLTADIMPIFTASCALGIPCHGVGSGKPPTYGGSGVMPADVYMGIVNVKSTEVATMNYVTPGDPSQSYIMRKLEQDNPGCDLTCTNPAGFPMGCVSRMPSGGPPWLDDPSVEKIRSWIKQGAKM